MLAKRLRETRRPMATTSATHVAAADPGHEAFVGITDEVHDGLDDSGDGL
jgi:hypothetical protein